jgi:hypothetical protein
VRPSAFDRRVGTDVMLVMSLIASVAVFFVLLCCLRVVGRIASVVTLVGFTVLSIALTLGKDNSDVPVMSALLLVLASAHIVSACIHVWRAEGARSWPTAAGWVARAAVREDTDADGDAEFRPQVTYVYDANGRSFVGKAVSFTVYAFHRWSKLVKAGLVLERGDSVKVYYCRTAPEVAVLRPGASRRMLFSCCFGAAQSLVAAIGREGAFGGWTLFFCGLILLANLSRLRGPETAVASGTGLS